jgi:hypothetical protein
MTPTEGMKMEWISVEDRLPSHMQKIEFKGLFPCSFKGSFKKEEDGYQFFFTNIKSNEIYNIYGVTHWMPLPELPKK